MARTWDLMHSRGGWSVMVHEAPGWTLLLERLWDRLCRLTRDRIVVLPEVCSRIPVGWPRWEHDVDGTPWLSNSLTMRMMGLESWMISQSRRRGREVLSVPVDVETARRIQPSSVAFLESLDDDEA